MLSFAVTKAIASQETRFLIPLFRYADPLYLFFQHYNAAHSDDKVEGLLPLWSDSVHFDHAPHVHHRETFRYFNNCIAAFGFLKFAFLTVLVSIRFPQMKGRGVWLVDMIGSELIR
jgi:hypothetical protein